jgi:hypothetical protein
MVLLGLKLDDLGTGRGRVAGAGSTAAALAVGAYPSTNNSATEEWSAPSLFSKENLGQVFYNSTSDAFKVTKQSVPAGTWSSGGSLSTARTL